MVTKAQRGFTVTELIVVVTIVAILMAIGSPSYRYVTTANRISSEINGLLGDLQFARAEAIREGQTVSVCATADGATCTTTGTAWSGGWLVFTDTPPLGQIDAPTDQILRIQKPLIGDSMSADNNIRALTFNRDGFAMGLPGAVTIRVQDSTANPAYTRCLSMTIVGATSTQLSGAQTAEGNAC